MSFPKPPNSNPPGPGHFDPAKHPRVGGRFAPKPGDKPAKEDPMKKPGGKGPGFGGGLGAANGSLPGMLGD